MLVIGINLLAAVSSQPPDMFEHIWIIQTNLYGECFV